MMYNPDLFDEGPIDPKSGFPSITPKPLGSLGIGGFRQQPLQPMMQLTMALHKLANKDNAMANMQRVNNTISGVRSLVNENFPSFGQAYPPPLNEFQGPMQQPGPYQPYGGRGGILSFGVPDPVNDPINYPDNPLNAGTFDQSKFLEALGSLTGSTTQQPIQSTQVSSMPSGMLGGGIGGMLGSLM